jgi:alpha-beta hydrolase superfamily lysophospholipase
VTPREAVVLLHGLGRSPYSMRSLATRLEAAGYAVHNVGYPSTRFPPDQLVARLAREVELCGREAARVHFVGHSLGGILVRAYLAEQRPANLGRLVMLAPPNHGSELADLFSRSRALRRVLGPVAPLLGTGAASFPNRLPAPDFEVGVIAGTRSLNPLGTLLIRGPHDGTVSLRSARLDGMADFATVASSHPFIMQSPRVAALVVAFLRGGRFYPASP